MSDERGGRAVERDCVAHFREPLLCVDRSHRVQGGPARGSDRFRAKRRALPLDGPPCVVAREVSNTIDNVSSDDDEEEWNVMDWKIELVAVPVSAVDRAKAFYVDKVGFNADHDQQVNEDLRFVQLTPPGSACSIYIGTGLTTMKPGSIEGLQMVVPDIEKAHQELAGRGVAVSDIEDLSWGRFVYFSDPDGNKWAIQQVPKRN